MRYTNALDARLNILIRGPFKIRGKALTLVELLLAIAIVGILAAIGVPMYNNYIDNARNSAAIAGVRGIESEIIKFQAERGMPPDTLAQAGLPTQLDPWGNPYQYLRLLGVPQHDLHGNYRRDRFTNPLNTDFDLYSMGKDGNSAPALTAKASYDDIVRANNGAFLGLASEY